MSFWTLETKADVGICGYSNSLPNLFREISLGMMNLLIPDIEARNLNQKIRKTAQWNVELQNISDDYESLILLWLEEILYKLEIENKFLVDMQCKLLPRDNNLACESQVSYVDADEVNRHLEIKAVTSHELLLKLLAENESYLSGDETIPELVGPAWVGKVIFDI